MSHTEEVKEVNQCDCTNLDCLCEDVLLYILKHLEFLDLYLMKRISKSNFFQQFIEKSIEATESITLTKRNTYEVLARCRMLKEIKATREACRNLVDAQRRHIQILKYNCHSLTTIRMETNALFEARKGVRFPNLTALSTSVGDHFTPLDFPKLQSITMINALSEAPLSSIKQFDSLTELRHVLLSSQADLDLVMALPCSRSLKTLDLCFLSMETVDFSKCASFPSLTTLNIAPRATKLVGLSHLANCCSNIKHLTIHSSSPYYYIRLLEKVSPTLQSVTICHWKIIMAINAAGIVLPSLTRLYIFYASENAPRNLHVVAPNLQVLRIMLLTVPTDFFVDMWEGGVDLRRLELNHMAGDSDFARHAEQMFKHNVFPNLRVFEYFRNSKWARVNEAVIPKLREHFKNCVVGPGKIQQI